MTNWTRGATLLALAWAGTVSQAQTGYAVNADRGLYRIDLGTAKVQKVCTLADDPFGLAIWPEDGSSNAGSVFVTDGSSGLRRVEDLTTGRLSGTLYTLSNNPVTALAYGVDPVEGEGLFASTDEEETGFVFTSLSKGPIKIIRPRPPFGHTKAMAIGSDGFVSMDETGDKFDVHTTTLLGDSALKGQLAGNKAAIGGIGFDGTGYWALDTAGTLYQLDVTGAKVTVVGDTGVTGWRDMDFGSPVPEPSQALAGVGVAALALRKRRR